MKNAGLYIWLLMVFYNKNYVTEQKVRLYNVLKPNVAC